MKRLYSYLWLTPMSFLITGIYSIVAISAIFIVRNKRQCADKLIRSWSAMILAIARVKLTVHNPHNVDFCDGRHYVLMCNHASVYDIPLSFMAVDSSLRMLAKKELRKIPLLGLAMQKIGFPFIDRNDRHQAMRDLEYAAQLMHSGTVIWIAPEGTRSRDGKLQSFKKGGFMMARKMQAVIVPVGIRGAFDITVPNSLVIHTGQRADIHIGNPIDTNDYKRPADRHRLMDDVHLAISNAIEGKTCLTDE